MKKSTLLTLFAAFMLIAGTAAVASAYDASNLRGSEARMLNTLTPEKRQAAEKVFAETDARISPLWESLRAKRLELDALSRNPGVTPQDISKLAAEVSALDGQLRKELAARGQKLSEVTGQPVGQGRGYSMGYGRGAGCGNDMGYGRGRGAGSGRGHGQGQGQGCGGCVYR